MPDGSQKPLTPQENIGLIIQWQQHVMKLEAHAMDLQRKQLELKGEAFKQSVKYRAFKQMQRDFASLARKVRLFNQRLKRADRNMDLAWEGIYAPTKLSRRRGAYAAKWLCRSFRIPFNGYTRSLFEDLLKKLNESIISEQNAVEARLNEVSERTYATWKIQNQLGA